MPVSVFLFQKEKTTIEEFMKNVFGFLSIVVLTGWSLFSISSCSDQYDDSEIKDRLDKVEDRVTKLEE